MPDNPSKFYLTTPIYYVNARPHIGHAYSTIAADVIARRHRLLGDDTFFLTGTDEHGQKVQRSAEKAGIPPQQFADEVSATFRDLWKRMGITNDDYIRTTDERHKRGVQKLWTLLEERGAIYLSTYTGQYSVGEEMFVEGPPGTIGPDGKPTETVTEENYFFKLSDYQEKLINLIESGELHFQPETAKNEILSFLRGPVSTGDQRSGAPSMPESHPGLGGNVNRSPAESTIAYSAAGNPYVPGALRDLSISRTTFDWGFRSRESEARHLRLARCACQLHDRGRLRFRRPSRHRQIRTLLARRSASRRQGDHPPTLHLLARVPDGRRPAAAEVCRRQRLAPVRRVRRCRSRVATSSAQKPSSTPSAPCAHRCPSESLGLAAGW